MSEVKKAVVTVLGIDSKGIIARVSAILFENDANILDISQTVLSGMFNMVMIIDVTEVAYEALSEEILALGKEMGLQMRVQRSEIFDAMHRI